MDEKKLVFNSKWEISQILKAGSVTIPSLTGSTDVRIFAYSEVTGLDFVPRAIITWKRSSDSRWQMNGAIMDPVSLYTVFALYKSDGVYIKTYDFTPTSVDVRYYIYTGGVIPT